MTRTSFTVMLKRGVAMDANHIAVSYRDGDRRPMLSFLCSGVQQCVCIDEIEDIRFHRDGCSHCSECEQSIHAMGALRLAPEY